MTDSREESPDWLHSFQAPKRAFLTLSSDSDPSQSNDEDDFCPGEAALCKAPKLQKGDNNQVAVLIDSEEESPISKAPKSKSKSTRVRAKVESQSQEEVEKNKDTGLIERREESQVEKAPKTKSPKKQLKVETQSINEENKVKEESLKEEIPEKRVIPHGSSRLPLLMSDKVHRSKALVECEGDSIDMSGDVGSVGRLVIADTPCGNSELLLDLKGTIYKTTIVPSRTFCIVNFGQTEAKIEAIMDDFIQLKPHSNVYEAETMIEGTLEGFSFESDEEADKIPKAKPQGDDAEELTNGKVKGKADKSLGVVRKKGKTAAKPPPKRARKKAQVPKKGKSSKK